MSGDVIFDVIARDRASATFRKTGSEVDALHSKLKAISTGVQLAAIAGIGLAFKTGFGELEDYSKGVAQLNAVIKSTGGAAGVTAQQMEALASKIQGYSGQTDDSIVKSEGLLATFTNIKNVAGANNDIFNQATIATADMAQTFGGDASQSAIKLGKALNDPITGLSALTRYGVTFTEQQKEQITTLAQSGQSLKAQKLILEALNEQVAGSARAFGDSLPGQIEKAKREWEDLTQQLVTELMPAILDVVGGLRDTVHFIQENESWIKPLAIGVGIAAAAWKSYTLAVKLAAAANLLLGRSGAAAAGGAAAGAAGTAAGGAAVSGGRLAAAKAIPVIGTLVAGATFAKGVTDSGNAKTAQAFNDMALAGGKSLANLRAESEKLGEALTHQGGIQALVTQKTKDAMDAAIALAPAEDKEAAAHGRAADAADKQTQSLGKLNDALVENVNKALAASSSADAFHSNLNALGKSVHDNGSGLDGFTNKAIANRDALRQAASSIFDHIAAMKDQGASAKTVRSALIRMEDKLRDSANETFHNRDATDALLKKWGLLPAQAKKALAGSHDVGKNAGSELGSGYVEGMSTWLDDIYNAAAGMAQQALNAIRGPKGQDSGSPSKKGRDAAHELGDGYDLGIEDSVPKVYETAAKMAQAAVDGIKSKLSDVRSAAQELRSTISDTILGNADFSTATTAEGLFVFLDSQRAADRQYRRNIRRIEHEGFSKKALEQILQLDPIANGALLASLADAPGYVVRGINDRYGDISTLADKSGRHAKVEIFGAPLDRITGELQRANALNQQAIHRLDRIEAALKSAPKHAASRGHAKVGHHHG